MIDTTPSTARRQNITLCSTVSEASGEDPAGSAWALRRIVLVELPLPWAYNSLRSTHAPAGLEELLWEVHDTMVEPWSMIGIAPDSAYNEGTRRIIDLRQGDDLATTGWAWTEVTITGITGEVTPLHGGLLTVTFTHPNIEAGTVEIDINPVGSVRTMDASKTGEYRDAPQYRATILHQQPPDCLDRLMMDTALNGS